MSELILLDTTPLSLAVHPRGGRQFAEWLIAARYHDRVVIPEIADYELRRELLRGGLEISVRRLDELIAAVEYLPLSTPIMRRAAALWAESRRQGRPTADPHALDGDVILAAGAQELTDLGHEVVVASDNVGHLSRFVDARNWSQIDP